MLCYVAEEVADQMILPYTTVSNANESHRGRPSSDYKL